MKSVRSYALWIVIAVLACTGAMTALYMRSIGEADRKVAQLQPVYERRGLIDSMTLILERYRRISGQFRKMNPDEIAQVKERLRKEVSDGVNRLNDLAATPQERTTASEVSDGLAELLRVSAKLEPSLFLKDAYYKVEIQEMHDQLLRKLDSLNESADRRIKALSVGEDRGSNTSIRLMIGLAAAILLLLISYIIRDHFVFIRPMERLRRFALELRAGRATPDSAPALGGTYGEVISALIQLSQTVESFRRERHKFILDVVSDLRAPLSLLKAGQALASGDTADDAQQIQAAEAVRRGLKLLSGSLDDLSDVVDINRLEARLEEKVIDLSELVSDVAKNLSGSGLSRQIGVSVPPMPVWALVDARRMERVLILVLNKVSESVPRGNRIQVSVRSPSEGNLRGIEILFQDAERASTLGGKGRLSAPTGPEQDLLRHWISESGFGMALVHKIAKAHGGSVTAAGVAGTTVQISVRIPPERMMSGGLIAPPSESPGVSGLAVKPFRATNAVDHPHASEAGATSNPVI